MNSEQDNKSFGKLILEARKNKQYSQRKLASVVKIHYSYLSKLEKDCFDVSPSKSLIQILAKELDLNYDKLFQLSGRIEPECLDNFCYLMRKHEEMPKLLKALRNSEWAKRIFELIDRPD